MFNLREGFSYGRAGNEVVIAYERPAKHPPQMGRIEIRVPVSEWASVVACTSYEGETTGKYAAALELLGTITDELPGDYGALSTDPTFEELSETIARYPDPDDKLTIALGNFNRVRAERDEVKKKWGGAEDLAVVWRERGLLAELERDAFKDALEYERSLNDSVVAPMRRALEEIAATTDVDMGGEYIIHNEPALSAVQASLRARKALHDITLWDHEQPAGGGDVSALSVDALADELLVAVRDFPLDRPFSLDPVRGEAERRLCEAYNRLYCELHDKAANSPNPSASAHGGAEGGDER